MKRIRVFLENAARALTAAKWWNPLYWIFLLLFPAITALGGLLAGALIGLLNGIEYGCEYAVDGARELMRQLS